MTKKIEIVLGLLLLTIPLILLWHTKKPPQIISYHVDSWGGQVIGRVERKYNVENSYNLVINGDYFAVNKEQYRSVEVGDKVLGFLNKGE